MLPICYFLLWTFILYWLHRLLHTSARLSKWHLHHHRYAVAHTTTWHWNNLFLFNDDWPSTNDLWTTEVIPTLIFSWITGQWWISVFYYVWAAFIQETLEHNPTVNWPILTSGRWHLMHHKLKCNYGLFMPLWDIVFKTYKKVD
jgi:sterol desaturase/sphingolipid hydroxylase (fatty acid hydroxylase superfamily)